MIVEYIRYAIDEPRQASFQSAYEQAADALDGSEHCVDYELSRCVDDPGSFILRIGWDSVEGHMQGFRQSTAFREFFQAIRPYVHDISEMRHYVVTLSGGATHG